MIALVEGAARQKTPNEIALNILLASLTIIFLLAVVTLQPLAIYSGAPQSGIVLVVPARLPDPDHDRRPALRDRHRRHGPARPAQRAGDVGPRRRGRRRRQHPAAGQDRHDHARQPRGGRVPPAERRRRRRSWRTRPQLSSLADETPEGRSIVVLAKREYGLRDRTPGELTHATFVPFSAQTRMSGCDLAENGQSRQVRKGATSAVREWVRENGGTPPADLGPMVDAIAGGGGTPLVVAEHGSAGARVLGVIHLKDIVKNGMRERFDELRRMGIRTVMITGDNPLTAKAIADEAGVDDFLAEATPEDKLALIRAGAGGRPARRDDRRRHQRRAGARAGRRRRRDEHRDVGRQGGRQHGRPRLQPDEADRDRRDRQAAAHHPRLADDVLDRQRRREVLRDPAGDVRPGLPGPATGST